MKPENSNFAEVDNDSKNHSVYIQPLGAAETVTGSKHLLKTPGLNVLVGCGLFEGIKSLRVKNWKPLPIHISTIGAVVITNASLDHCGYIPLLVKNGYSGKIYMNGPTRQMTELILRENALIQEEDAQKANQHGFSKHHPAMPLYTIADVEAALPQFVIVETNEKCLLSDDVYVRFLAQGQSCGGYPVIFECYGKTIVFVDDTSELKPEGHLKNADYIVMESTFGDRQHERYNIAEHLSFIINKTISRQGDILIPCFATDSALKIVNLLFKLKRRKEIPSDLAVILDSPIAGTTIETFKDHPALFSVTQTACNELIDGIIINEDKNHTENIIRRKNYKIILAASDMLCTGRVLEYLKHYAGDSRNTILFNGFQAGGTRGRALLNGAKEIKIHGRYYPVNAEVAEIDDLLPHSDQSDIISQLINLGSGLSEVFLVHGEFSALEALRVKINSQLHLNAKILKQGKQTLLFDIAMHEKVAL